MIHHRFHHITVDTVVDPNARQREADQRHQRRHRRHGAGAQVQFTHGTHLQIGRALRQDHRHANNTGQQAKRIQQLEEVTGVVQAQIFINVERNALQQVAERHANHQRRHEAADEDAPVPHVTPAVILNLRAVVETHRTEE